MLQILDCTLRDGGYVNNWEFSEDTTKNVITALIDSGAEIIECGFISETKGRDKDTTLFREISQVDNILNTIDRDLSKTSFCVMVNRGEINLDQLPDYDDKLSHVKGLRFAFHKRDWQAAILDLKIMIDKGYSVYAQPMVTLAYTDTEILAMIAELNKLELFAAYIVDSFGAMVGDDFRRLHYLFEHNLKSGISLGFHSHNNMQLAYSNAIDFINIKSDSRNIIIDSSIHGMGRGAGNLTTELLADYLNKKQNRNYDIIPLLDVIDRSLESIYREYYWGYSIAHFLSASFNCHPNYSSFLVETKTLSIVDMQEILSKLSLNERNNYSKDLIRDLYIAHKSVKLQDVNFDPFIFNMEQVTIIASGPSIEYQSADIKSHISQNNQPIIVVNHIPQDIEYDYCFFSNQGRFEKYQEIVDTEKLIITSNIKPSNDVSPFAVLDYHDLVLKTSNQNDNVTILLLSVLIECGVKKASLCGFDGYRPESKNYFDSDLEHDVDSKVLQNRNESNALSLSELKKFIDLTFITNSIFAGGELG
jgi:4-hydroxy 2-oxovalerate aldolase